MSTIVYVAFLVTASFVCGVVEAAPRPNNNAIKGAVEKKASETTSILCPTGYVAVENYCYMVNLQLAQQQQHQDHCYQTGGYLVDIQTESESDAIKEYLRTVNFETYKYDNLFIGLMDVNVSSSQVFWMWMSGNISFKNWTPGHPQSSNRRCAAIMLNDENFGRWQDARCLRIKGAICEADPL